MSQTFTTQDGTVRSAEQIEAAFAACRQLELAYARASEDNGGNSSISWEDVDLARALANEAISDQECVALQEQALQESQPSYEFKRPEDTEGGSCD